MTDPGSRQTSWEEALVTVGGFAATRPGEGPTLPPTCLPAPSPGDPPLMEILRKRKTAREFASRALDSQLLSDLLWAAYGINRRESGKRTAPSAHDGQYVDVYVAHAGTLHRYDAAGHELREVGASALRTLTESGFASSAPLTLFYVADEERMEPTASGETRALYAAVTTGSIVQNVYLFCAATGLNTAVRVDPVHLAGPLAPRIAPRQVICSKLKQHSRLMTHP